MTGLVIVHLAACAGLTALVLQTVLNLLTLPRLERIRPPVRHPRVSVLIPARNEAERIGASLRSWAAQDYPDHEVLVYDDDSSDDTAARALDAAATAPQVRIIRGTGLPPGWRGKPWACHRLRSLATGEILVFADADVIPTRDTLTRTVGALEMLGAHALSAVPAHEGGSLAVRALAPIQHWAALALVPSWLAPTRRSAWLSAMAGVFIAIPARVYDAIGGFAAARGSLAEDATLGRRLVAGGYSVRLLDGARTLRCRSYQRLDELWRAATRNLLPVFFGSSLLLLLAFAAGVGLYVGPALMLSLGLVLGRGVGWLWTWLPLVEIALGVASRCLSNRRAGSPLALALLHPAAVAALAAMGVASVVTFRLRRVVEWRGRRYDVAA